MRVSGGGMNGGPAPPTGSPAFRGLERRGTRQESSSWGRPSGHQHPSARRAWANGRRRLPERARCRAGVPLREWPIILLRGRELRVSLCPQERPLWVIVSLGGGDKNLYRGQASSENTWPFRPLALHLSSAAWDPWATHGGGGEGWASKHGYALGSGPLPITGAC